MHNKKLLFLLSSAALLLSACGNQGGNSSSSQSSLSSDPISSSSSSSSSDSSVEEPVTDEQLGVLKGTFNGENYLLNVTKDVVTLLPRDASLDALTFTPKKAYVYTQDVQGNDGITTEHLLSLDMVDASNAKYRLRFTSGEYHFIGFYKQNEDLEYERLDVFMPGIDEFVGSYNGYTDIPVDTYNYIYLYSGSFDADYLGYPVYLTHPYSESYSQTSLFNRSFYVEDEDGNYTKAIDQYDISDGEYWEFAVVVGETGLDYVDGGACWYPDFTLLTLTLVDENGNRGDYYDYDVETNMLSGPDFEDIGEATLHHDDYGFYYTFGEASLRLSGDIFHFENGDESYDYAPLYTFYEVNYFGTEFISEEESLYFVYDLDWDTYDDIFTVKYNGVDVLNPLIKADGSGKAVLYFNVNDEDYAFYKENAYYGYFDREEREYLYNATLFDEVYIHDYWNATQEIVTIDSDRSVVFNDVVYNAYYTYNSLLSTVVLAFGDYVLAMYAENLYVLLGEDVSLTLVIEEAVLAMDGVYHYGGMALFSVNNGVLSIGVEETEYTYELLDAGNSEYVLAWKMTILGNVYYMVPDYHGIFDMYAVEDNKINFVGSILKEEYFNALVGEYCMESVYGVEYIAFNQAGVLRLSTLEDDQLVMKNYDYHVSYDEENSCLLLHVHVEAEDGSIRYVTFELSELGLTLQESSMLYMRRAYFLSQGVYLDETNGAVIYINGDDVYENGTLKNATFAIVSGGVQATYGDVVIDILQEGNTIKRGENDPIALTKLSFDIADYVGVFEYNNHSFELKLNSATGKYTVYEDDNFFSDYYKLVYEDGCLKVVFSTPFGEVKLHLDGIEVVAEIQLQAIPSF